MLKSRITRIIAGIIACAMVFICAAQAAYIDIKTEEKYDAYYELDNIRHEDVSEINNLYRKLIIAGYMYFNNLDENGRFEGTIYKKEQTIALLKGMGIMDESGRIAIDGLGKFEYRMSINGQEYSNTDKTHDQLLGECSVVCVNGEILSDNDLWVHHGSGLFNWFTTNYGMTYYYIDGSGYAVFDFDTTDCDSYVDELGATIYYKLDGSTPIPYDYVDLSEYMTVENEQTYNFDEDENFYGESENERYAEHAIIVDETGEEQAVQSYTEEVTVSADETENTTVPAVIETERPTIPFVDETKFEKIQMPENDIIITISPSEEIVANIEKLREIVRGIDEYAAKRFLELIPFGAIAMILSLYVLVAGGYSKKEKKFVLTSGDKVFAELYVGIGVLAVTGAVLYCDYIYEVKDFFERCYSLDMFDVLTGAVAAVLFGLLLFIFNSFIIRLKCRSFMKTTLTYRIFKWICRIAAVGFRYLRKIFGKISAKTKDVRTEFLKNIVSRDMLRNDKFTRSFILRTGIAVVLMILVCITSAGFDDFGSRILMLLICGLIIFAAYIYFSLADLKAIQRLNEHISAVNSGDYTEHNEPLDSPIYVPTEKLNNISTGIQGTVEKQVKSERMKIELVTNVSHDLKTPLTSIISYIDLLSAEELPPAARDYVTIIEEKSQRLKTMVADLFDLAKAASRTDVQAEEIDAVVLTRQVLGDLADKIEASGRILKCDIQAESAPINADGKKMYRVFQNIIDNALKYSMEGTRVYLTLKNEDGMCRVTVKNIASYEMTFSPDEITERFTRGDESRSTEGNGLGLSIAKSFTEANGGQFRVDVDGDVFAAIVSMPLM